MQDQRSMTERVREPLRVSRESSRVGCTRRAHLERRAHRVRCRNFRVHLRRVAPLAAVVQPTDARQRDYLRARRWLRLLGPAHRRLLAEPVVSSIVVMIRNILAQQPPKVRGAPELLSTAMRRMSSRWLPGLERSELLLENKILENPINPRRR